jgi:hypothetical protein
MNIKKVKVSCEEKIENVIISKALVLFGIDPLHSIWKGGLISDLCQL